MKHLYLLIISFFFFSFPGFSQTSPPRTHKDKEQKFMEYKMKYLAQEMNLKEDQKQKFYDLYTQMWAELKTAYGESDALRKKIKDTPNASEEDYKDLRESERISKEKADIIEQKYDERFSEFLTQKQMFEMKEAEKKFRNRMREIHHERKMKFNKSKNDK